MTFPQYRRGECRLNGALIHLTYFEKQVLLLLMLRTGMWTSARLVIEFLWENPNNEPDSAYNNVTDLIRRLRRKLGSKSIQTRPCFGYMMEPQHD